MLFVIKFVILIKAANKNNLFLYILNHYLVVILLKEEKMYSIAICNSDRLDLSLLSQYVELWLNQHKEIDWKITTFLQVDELVKMIDKKKYFDL